MMKSKVLSSLYNLLFNYINSFLNVVYGVILVPVYLHYFDISTYGAWLASGNIIAIMGIFDLGMNLVFAQKLAAFVGGQKWIEYSKEYTAGIFISMVIIVLLIFTGVLLAPYIPKLVNARFCDYKVISKSFIFAVLAAGLTILFQNMAAGLQALLETKILGVITSISLIVGIAVTIYCVLNGYGVLSIPLGVFVRNVITTIGIGILTVKLWKKYGIKYHSLEKIYVNQLLAGISPVFASRTATMFLQNNQLVIIANVLGAEVSAIYNITGKCISTIGMFIMPIASSVFASMSQLHGEGEKTKILSALKQLLHLVTIVLCVSIGGCIFLNKGFIHLWVNDSNYGGDLLTTLIAISFIVNVRANILNTLLMAMGKMVSTSIAGLLSALLQFLLILIGISIFGIIIVPLAEIISTLIFRTIVLVKVYKDYFLFSWKESVKLNLIGYEVIIPIVLIGMVLQIFVPTMRIYFFTITVSAWSAIITILFLIIQPYRSMLFGIKKRF